MSRVHLLLRCLEDYKTDGMSFTGIRCCKTERQVLNDFLCVCTNTFELKCQAGLAVEFPYVTVRIEG